MGHHHVHSVIEGLDAIVVHDVAHHLSISNIQCGLVGERAQPRVFKLYPTGRAGLGRSCGMTTTQNLKLALLMGAYPLVITSPGQKP